MVPLVQVTRRALFRVTSLRIANVPVLISASVQAVLRQHIRDNRRLGRDAEPEEIGGHFRA